MAKKIEAFFVTPIGEEGSEVRQRADNLLKHVLEPIFASRFNIIRADLIDAPGNINHDIIERLYSSALVIADLTGFNPNVMYEVGVRHSFNKPIVQIAQKGEKLPFDVGTERTIFFDINDLASVDKAKERLKNAVVEVMRTDRSYQSPIFGILNRAAVFDAGGDVAEALETLADNVDSLGDRMWDALNGGLGYGSSAYDDRVIEMVTRMYDVFSALPVWEAERLIDKLRKL